jgi:hypothetical protein
MATSSDDAIPACCWAVVGDCTLVRVSDVKARRYPQSLDAIDATGATAVHGTTKQSPANSVRGAGDP